MLTRTLSSLALTVLAALPAAAGTVYDNTSNWTGSNAVLTGSEWADDLHMTSGGEMSGFQFGYISNGSTSATIRFYANDAANSNLPVSGNDFHTEVVSIPGGGASGVQTVTLGSTVTVPQHMWMSVQYNGSSGTMRLCTPPTIGTSDANMVVHVSSGYSGAVFGPDRNSFQFSVSLAEGAAWTDLGNGLAGTNGVPQLAADGTLAAGTAYSFDLSSARSNSLAVLMVGTSRIDLAFRGGTLVPSPDDLLIVATNGSGEISLAGTAPSGLPVLTDVYAQFWIADPVGPQGYAASNAVMTTTP